MLDLHLDSSKLEIGCDEAGRGCLSGPVYAGAVLLPPSFRTNYLMIPRNYLRSIGMNYDLLLSVKL